MLLFPIKGLLMQKKGILTQRGRPVLLGNFYDEVIEVNKIRVDELTSRFACSLYLLRFSMSEV